MLNAIYRDTARAQNMRKWGLRTVPFCVFLLAFSPMADAQVAGAQVNVQKNGLKKVDCTGEFSTGSGVLGSSVGETCFIDADTDQERRIQDVCAQNSTCKVTAMASMNADGTKELEKILSVQQTAPPSQ